MAATVYNKPVTGLVNAIPAMVLILIFSIITLVGCETITTISEHRRVYCDRTTDSVAKGVAIEAIREDHSYYPEEGICTDFGEAYFDRATAEAEVQNE